MRTDANDPRGSPVIAKLTTFEKEIDPASRPTHSAVGVSQPPESTDLELQLFEDLIELGYAFLTVHLALAFPVGHRDQR